MATTVYSHAFLVGSFNSVIKPQDLDTNVWERQIMTSQDYNELLSDYYQSLVDSMVESDNQARPSFLQSVCHYCINIDSEKNHHFTICLTKGRKEEPFNYPIYLCKLHLFFFPHDIVLVVLEIDDTGVDLDQMTLGHGSLINLKFGKTGNDEFIQKLKPLLDLVDSHDLKHLVKDGNNLKIFQIVEVEAQEPSDNLLFEIGTFIPVGAVGGTDAYSPSNTYFSKIISENSISAFYNWKALALVDSFTVLGIFGFNTWTWENLYFPLIYLRCIYEKTFCFSRNSAYRLGKAVKDISQEIADMEKYYFYNNISYNFLPEMLYDSMVKGIGLKEEREEISKQIKERAKEEETKQKEQNAQEEQRLKDREEKVKESNEKRFNNILSYATIFAVFSVAWDLCSMLKDALCIRENKNIIAWIFIGIAILFIVMLIYMIKNNIDIVGLYKKVFKTKTKSKKIIILNDTREHFALHFQKNFPGSKFYCESPEALIELAQQQFPNAFENAKPDIDGRYRISVTFPNVIGVSNVVSIEDLTEEEKAKIAIVDRQGKKVRSVKTNRENPTKKCHIILSSDWHLITMFPGELAPPLPDSPDIPDEFWDNHVFIEPISK